MGEGRGEGSDSAGSVHGEKLAKERPKIQEFSDLFRVSAFGFYDLVPSHRPPCDPAGRPRRLEIEATRESVNIEDFTSKIKVLTDTALHRLKIHLIETHPAAGDKLVLVDSLAIYLWFHTA